MKLLINVGGRGKRMGNLTREIPKPMILLSGKPILEYLVLWAKNNHFDSILLLCGYKHEIIQQHFSNGDKFGINISYSVEPEPLGSGGAIKFAQKHIDHTFAYISGDLFCEVNFSEMLDSHRKSKAVMTALLQQTDHPEDSDILEVDKNNRIVKFISKNDDHTDTGNLGNAGLCIMEPVVLEYMDKKVFTLETYLYPRLLKYGEYLNAYITDETIKDIGTPARLTEFESAEQN